MAIYQRKPLNVDAWQLGGGFPHPLWLANAIESGVVALQNAGTFDETAIVKTAVGGVTAPSHAMLVRSPLGEIYPAALETFMSTHMLISADGELPAEATTTEAV